MDRYLYCPYPYCPMCVDTRIHPQPFQDEAGRLLCGACYFLDGEAVEMRYANSVFPELEEREGIY